MRVELLGSILTAAHTLMWQIYGSEIQEAMSRFKMALIFVSKIPKSGSSIDEHVGQIFIDIYKGMQRLRDTRKYMAATLSGVNGSKKK